MPVVLDPNVLISAVLSPAGAPAELIRRWLAGEFELLVSPKLIAELTRALTYPKISKRIPPRDAAELTGLLESEARSESDPSVRLSLRIEDPGDEYLVALAMEHGAALVSGDAHLTVLADRLPVFSPADFLRRLEKDHRSR